jgi:hypothetical protein
MNSSFEQLQAAEQGMAEAVTILDTLKSKVAMAKQIIEFCSDRRKSALSNLVVEYLKQDLSTVAAEHHARSDARFKAEMKTIMQQTGEAEKVVKEWELARIKFECARSLLSAERSLLELR